jgi:hypothetical protein
MAKWKRCISQEAKSALSKKQSRIDTAEKEMMALMMKGKQADQMEKRLRGLLEKVMAVYQFHAGVVTDMRGCLLNENTIGTQGIEIGSRRSIGRSTG